MLHLRGIGPILALLIGVAVPGILPAATFHRPPSQPSDAALHHFVSLSMGEMATSPSGAAATIQEPDLSDNYLLAAMAIDDNEKKSDDLDNVVRHRGFTKALLIIVSCGALIRFFTSTTFLDFISDALDPNAW